MTPSPSRRPRGLTLIEVMVASAVLGIMGTLAFGVLMTTLATQDDSLEVQQRYHAGRIAIERLRQYRSAVVTAEAMIWHHGYKGLDAALKAIEAEPDDFRERVRADLVARLAADRYQRFKQADVFERALLLELWSRRRGQMIRA